MCFIPASSSSAAALIDEVVPRLPCYPLPQRSAYHRRHASACCCLSHRRKFHASHLWSTSMTSSSTTLLQLLRMHSTCEPWLWRRCSSPGNSAARLPTRIHHCFPVPGGSNSLHEALTACCASSTLHTAFLLPSNHPSPASPASSSRRPSSQGARASRGVAGGVSGGVAGGVAGVGGRRGGWRGGRHLRVQKKALPFGCSLS